jgi:LacI family transcriptional regulator
MSTARRVTLRDVATAVGVSTATVSRALNEDKQISLRTRVLVADAAEQLGYVPDAAARSLAVRASRTFGLMVPDATDPVHGTVIAGFEQAAHAAGYTVIIANSLGDATLERRALRGFTGHRADGIALMGSVLDHETVLDRARPSPVVFLNSERLSRGRVADLPIGCLRPDEPDGVRLLVEHLVAQGRRRLAYVGARRVASNHVRREAVSAQLRDRPGTELAATLQWAYETRVDLARALVAAGVDAVIGYDDRVALSLLDGFRSIGVRVPDDVAVAGFDDIPFAAIANPRLTTVAQPAGEMGALAVQLLLDSIGGGSLGPSRVLPVQLVVRESTTRRTASASG